MFNRFTGLDKSASHYCTFTYAYVTVFVRDSSSILNYLHVLIKQKKTTRFLSIATVRYLISAHAKDRYETSKKHSCMQVIFLKEAATGGVL